MLKRRRNKAFPPISLIMCTKDSYSSINHNGHSPQAFVLWCSGWECHFLRSPNGINLLQEKRYQQALGKLWFAEPQLIATMSRAFSFVGPTPWNSLPQEVRQTPSLLSFRCLVRTFYFRRALWLPKTGILKHYCL